MKARMLLYFLAVWIMFDNGQIWKYPQAWGWNPGGPMYTKDYRKKTFVLECDSLQNVVEIPQYKVKKIGFSMKEADERGYYIYRNPTCVDQGGQPVFSQEYEIVVINGIRTGYDTTGKTYIPPTSGHTCHYTILGALK